MRSSYDTIYVDLKQDIEAGQYRYKDMLPSESTLVKRYSCAHNTARKAIAQLAREGYVQPVHGKGVRVIYKSTPLLTAKRAPLEPSDLQTSSEAFNRNKNRARTKVLSMETIEVSTEIAKLTGFESGDSLVHLERVRYFDGKPLSRESNYFRADIVAGMTKEDAERSTYHYIEDVHGDRLVTCKHVITVEPVEDRDVELLELGSISHVVNLVTCGFDSNGMLCEVTNMRQNPDGFSYTNAILRSRIGQD